MRIGGGGKDYGDFAAASCPRPNILGDWVAGHDGEDDPYSMIITMAIGDDDQNVKKKKYVQVELESVIDQRAAQGVVNIKRLYIYIYIFMWSTLAAAADLTGAHEWQIER